MRSYLLCLLVLSTSVLGQNVNERYKKFINQHINQRMSVNRCDEVMNSRRITQTNSNQCKETNTFILSGTNNVKTVCGQGGRPHEGRRDMTVSNQPFPLIICEQRNNNRYPRCEYRGRSTTRYIVIKCEQGFPVHFDGDIGVVN